ncbi:hypothetical protein VFPPC_18416 [Pochonia chlamydosporia 170]|uniref:Uncharacterized protein n=1 Tax=Pochonia chlamydosporia 170 TaxID=1380566 RepID=A0A219APB2_METCM|nr:hypothetical protein VFPPC_18416 [Pochonia chlamydosporia 170]OWT42429.1 hypothetical protein VFPPC_18416 [Pochonia chlamydosporia 170]
MYSPKMVSRAATLDGNSALAFLIVADEGLMARIIKQVQSFKYTLGLHCFCSSDVIKAGVIASLDVY